MPPKTNEDNEAIIEEFMWQMKGDQVSAYEYWTKTMKPWTFLIIFPVWFIGYLFVKATSKN